MKKFFKDTKDTKGKLDSNLLCLMMIKDTFKSFSGNHEDFEFCSKLMGEMLITPKTTIVRDRAQLIKSIVDIYIVTYNTLKLEAGSIPHIIGFETSSANDDIQTVLKTRRDKIDNSLLTTHDKKELHEKVNEVEREFNNNCVIS